MTDIILSRNRLVLMLIALTLSLSINAQENSNPRQARQIFDKTYNMVFGPQGCNLTYAVNIVGVYKTEGTIWMKRQRISSSFLRM